MRDYLDSLNWRYAVKEFLPDKIVPEEIVSRVLEAGRLSPSSNNFQPWKFYVISDKSLQSKLMSVSYDQPKVGSASHVIVLAAKNQLLPDDAQRLLEANSASRQMDGEEQGNYKKYLEKLVMSNKMSGRKDSPEEVLEDQKKRGWLEKQVYIALGMMIFAAALEGVDAGPMEGFQPKKVDELLDIDQNFHSVAMLTLGYRDSEKDKFASIPKVRYPKEEVVVNKS